jgi:hypothetical protein
MVTGIGGGLGAANIMGMFGQQNTAAGQQPWRTDLQHTIGQRGPYGIE